MATYSTLHRVILCLGSVLLTLGGVGVLAQSPSPPQAPLLSVSDEPPADFQGGVHDFTGLPLTADGWTDLDAMITSAGYSDARILYVSNAGNDSTGQVYTQAQVNALGGTPTNPSGSVNAFLTPATARANLRKGFPDVMLYRRGDSFSVSPAGNLPDLRGRSQTERVVIAAYGSSGDLPTFTGAIATGIGGGIPAGDGNFLIVAHLEHRNPQRDPDDPAFDIGATTSNSKAINMLTSHQHVLLEGLRALYAGFAIEGFDGNIVEHIALRRNVVYNNYTTGNDHAQGMYFHAIDHLLLEENVLDHHGWNESVAGANQTVFRHGVYVQYTNRNVIARGNIFHKNSATGMQGRPGGIYDNNTFLDEAIPLFISGLGGSLSYNVVLGGGDRTFGDRAWGLVDQANGAVTFDGNIVANKHPGVSGHSWGIELAQGSLDGASSQTVPYEEVDGPKVFSLRNNVVYNWASGGIYIGDADAPAGNRHGYASGVIEGNAIQGSGGDPYVLQRAGHAWDFSIYSFANNKYLTAQAQPFRDSTGNRDFSTWVAYSGETGATFNSHTFPDPSRTISTYMTSVGMSGDTAEFMEEVRQQTIYNWRPAFTAQAVNSYIREGFGVVR